VVWLLEIKRIYEFDDKTKEEVASEIFDLYLQHGEGLVSMKDFDSSAKILENPERYYCLVKDGEIIGVGAIYMRRGKIMRICIKREYRNRGYGKLLLAFLVSLALAVNDTAYMYVKKRNEVMLRLAKKFNFTIESYDPETYLCTLRRRNLRDIAVKLLSHLQKSDK